MRKILRLLVVILALSLLAACGGKAPEKTLAPTTGSVPGESEGASVPETAAPPADPVPEEYTGPSGYDHTALAGTWVRTGTEVEGDVNPGGNCTLVITACGDGTYLITYADRDFHDSDYSEKTLRIVEEPLYAACDNDRWMGVIDHSAMPGVTHGLTIQDDGTLVLQNSFTVDGMPMVSYEFFARQP